MLCNMILNLDYCYVVCMFVEVLIKTKNMEPTQTKIETGYFTSQGEIVEFFYSENEDDSYNVEVKTEYQVNFDELLKMRKCFDEFIHSFKEHKTIANIRYTLID